MMNTKYKLGMLITRASFQRSSAGSEFEVLGRDSGSLSSKCFHIKKMGPDFLS